MSIKVKIMSVALLSFLTVVLIACGIVHFANTSAYAGDYFAVSDVDAPKTADMYAVFDDSAHPSTPVNHGNTKARKAACGAQNSPEAKIINYANSVNVKNNKNYVTVFVEDTSPKYTGGALKPTEYRVEGIDESDLNGKRPEDIIKFGDEAVNAGMYTVVAGAAQEGEISVSFVEDAAFFSDGYELIVDSNYNSFTIEKASLSLSGSFYDSRQYDGERYSKTIKFTTDEREYTGNGNSLNLFSDAGGDVPEVTVTISTFSEAEVGSYFKEDYTLQVKTEISDAHNFNTEIDISGCTFTVEILRVKVKITSLEWSVSPALYVGSGEKFEMTYDGKSHDVFVNGKTESGESVSLTVKGADGKTFKNASPDGYVFTAEIPEDEEDASGYEFSPGLIGKTFTVVVNRAEIQLNTTYISVKYTGEGIDVSDQIEATGVNGLSLDVTFSYKKSGVPIEGSLPVGAGEYEIIVTSRDGNYNPATVILRIVSAVENINVVWAVDGTAQPGDNYEMVYDGRVHKVSATGYADGMSCELIVDDGLGSDSFSDANADGYRFGATFPKNNIFGIGGDVVYYFTAVVNKAGLKVEWGGVKTYNGEPQSAEITLTGVGGDMLSGGAYTLTYETGGRSLGLNPPRNAGSYTVSVTLNGAYARNYNAVDIGTFEITPAPVTLSINNEDRPAYTGNALIPTNYTVDGLIDSDLNGKSPKEFIKFGTQAINAGTYTVVLSESGLVQSNQISVSFIDDTDQFISSNYTLEINSAANLFTITQAKITIVGTYSATNQYNGEMFKDIISLGKEIQFAKGIEISSNTSAFTDIAISISCAKNAATYNPTDGSGIKIILEDISNFTYILSATFEIKITPAPVTLSINNEDHPSYTGAALVPMRYTVEGLIESDLNGKSPKEFIKFGTQAINAGTYTIVLSVIQSNQISACFVEDIDNFQSSNYVLEISEEANLFTIDQAQITLFGTYSATNQYNGEEFEDTIALGEEIQSASGLTISSNTSAFTNITISIICDKNAATYTPIDGQGVSVILTDSANFTYILSATFEVEITPAPVTLSVNNEDRPAYTGNSLVPTNYAVEGLIESDLDGKSPTEFIKFGSEAINAGTYTAVLSVTQSNQISVCFVGDIANFQSSNYKLQISEEANLFTISQAQITISGTYMATNQYNGEKFDDTITLGEETQTARGLSVLSNTSAFTDIEISIICAKNVSTYNPTDGSGVSVILTDSANFTYILSATFEVEITPAPVTLTINNEDCLSYTGTALIPTNYTVEGLVESDLNGKSPKDFIKFGSEAINAGTYTAVLSVTQSNQISVCFIADTNQFISFNYKLEISSAANLFTISQAQITISGTYMATNQYNGEEFKDTISLGEVVQSASGLTISSNTSAFTNITISIICDKNAATYNPTDGQGVNVILTDSANFTYILSATFEVEITPATVTLSVNNEGSPSYTGNALAPTNYTVDGLIDSDLNGKSPKDFVNFGTQAINAGTYTVVLSDSATQPNQITASFIADIDNFQSSNYKLQISEEANLFTINKAKITISGTYSATNRYNGKKFEDTITLGGTFQTARGLTISSNTSAFTDIIISIICDKNAATYTPTDGQGVSVILTDSTNFTYILSVTFAVEITPATVTLGINNEDCPSYTGNALAPTNYTVDGLIDSDLNGKSPKDFIKFGTQAVNAGTYTVVLSDSVKPNQISACFVEDIDNFQSSNYTLKINSATNLFTITQAQITIVGTYMATNQYNGEEFKDIISLGKEIQFAKGIEISSNTSAFTDITISITCAKNVSTYNPTDGNGVNVVLSDSANFTYILSATFEIEITPAPVTLSINNEDRPSYTGNAIAPTNYTVDGLIDSDLNGKSPKDFVNFGTQAVNAGTYTIVLSDNATQSNQISVCFVEDTDQFISSNYKLQISEEANLFTINKAKITISGTYTATNQYTGEEFKDSISLNKEIQSANGIEISSNTSAFTDIAISITCNKNVATYNPTDGNEVSVVLSDSANFIYVLFATFEVEITPAPVTLSINNEDRPAYTGNSLTPANYAVEGLVESDLNGKSPKDFIKFGTQAINAETYTVVLSVTQPNQITASFIADIDQFISSNYKLQINSAANLFTISQAKITISGTYTATNRYNGEEFKDIISLGEVVQSASGLTISSDSSALTEIIISITCAKNAATYTPTDGQGVSVILTDSTNFTYILSATFEIEITPATVTLSINNEDCPAYTGTTLIPTNYTVDGLVESDLDGTPATDFIKFGSEAINAGTYTVILSDSAQSNQISVSFVDDTDNFQSSNYKLQVNEEANLFTISQAKITIVGTYMATNQYNGEKFEDTISLGGTFQTARGLTISSNTSAFTDIAISITCAKNAATYNPTDGDGLQITLADDKNFTYELSATFTVTITPITISREDMSFLEDSWLNSSAGGLNGGRGTAMGKNSGASNSNATAHSNSNTTAHSNSNATAHSNSNGGNGGARLWSGTYAVKAEGGFITVTATNAFAQDRQTPAVIILDAARIPYIKTSSGDVQAFAVEYVSGCAQTAGVYVYEAVVRLRLNPNFVWAESYVFGDDYGLTLSESAGVLTVKKNWYVVETVNGLETDLFIEEGGAHVESWQYGSDISVTEPTLQNGLTSADALWYTLKAEIDGKDKILVEDIPFHSLGKWLNKAAPAGTYVIILTVAAFEDGGRTYPAVMVEYVFKVTPKPISVRDENYFGVFTYDGKVHLPESTAAVASVNYDNYRADYPDSWNLPAYDIYYTGEEWTFKNSPSAGASAEYKSLEELSSAAQNTKLFVNVKSVYDSAAGGYTEQAYTAEFTVTAQNYTVYTGRFSILIKRARLTAKVSLSTQIITYGSPIPQLAVDYIGLADGETFQTAGITPATYSTDYDMSLKSRRNAGSYYYIFDCNARAMNYNIDYNVGDLTFEVIPREITAVWGETYLFYTGGEQCPSVTVEGVVYGDVVQISIGGKATLPGTYLAIASISDENYRLANNSVWFTIAGKVISDIIWQSPSEYVYSGRDIPVPKALGILSTGEEVSLSVTGDVGADVGGYAFEIVKEVGYTYPAGTRTKFTVTVTAAQAEATTDISAVYDGRNHALKTLAVTWSGGTLSDDEYKLSGNATAVSAGRYEYLLTLSSEDFTFGDGREKSVFLNIFKAVADVPKADERVFVYNGSEQTYGLKSCGLYFVSGNKMTNAGEYEVTVTLNDKTNFEWSCGGVGDIKFPFIIRKAKPTINCGGEYKFVYDGAPHGIDMPGVPWYVDNVEISYNGYNVLPQNAGEYEVTVVIAGTANYEEAELKTKLIISKREISVNWLNIKIFVADGLNHTPFNGLTDGAEAEVVYRTAEGVALTSAPAAAGEYIAAVRLTDGANYMLTGDTEMSFSIRDLNGGGKNRGESSSGNVAQGGESDKDDINSDPAQNTGKVILTAATCTISVLLMSAGALLFKIFRKRK